jgi:hypothetical protein
MVTKKEKKVETFFGALWEWLDRVPLVEDIHLFKTLRLEEKLRSVNIAFR